jgi:hypothetical protein
VPRDPAVSRPGSRLPQVSPGRTRRHPQRRGSLQRAQVTTVTAAPTTATDGGKGSPTPPRTPVTVRDLPVTVPTSPVPLPPPPVQVPTIPSLPLL